MRRATTRQVADVPHMRARRLIAAAIETLDREGAPADIAAHLDFALHLLSRTADRADK